ncbi:MAG: Hydroxyacylglutathione hydrolase [Promethearchaeota archaeon]|nr:MAG: Hydroxyacylglutathione hydrolase [Candidatus Lokiarchaeota archaeon]
MIDYIIPLFEDANIYFIQGQNGGRVPYSNCVVMGDYIIDTGISPVRLKRLKKKFVLKNLCFSHWHDDHIRDCKNFVHLPFYCHPEARPIIEDIDKLLDLYNIRNSPAEKPFKLFLSQIIDAYGVKIAGTFEHNEVITIDNGLEVHILYTPGHSKGHCIFHIPELKFAFIGDIDLSKFGPWYGGIDSDIIKFMVSIDTISKLNLETVVTGHRGLVKGKDVIQQELEKYKAIFKRRERMIMDLLSPEEPRNPKDLLEKNIIYKRYEFLKPFLLAMEQTMIQKHFDKLIAEHKIAQEDEGFVLV